MKGNSIVPYNNAILNYLNYLIIQESDRAAAGKPRSEPDATKQQRKEYDVVFEVLTKELEPGANREVPDKDGVDQLVNNLCGLKHWGKRVQDIKTAMGGAQSTAYRKRTYRATKGGRQSSRQGEP
ncbi:MAG: hypothetical protein M1839_009364 [Geoglossum umbratile]|nr:MAG: hypothetical protein M1839_009364 [Geoglossum umbratile]